MQRYKFIVKTIQSVELDAESFDAAKQVLQLQLPLGSEIVRFVDCDTGNLRQLNSAELGELLQSGKLTSELKSDIINIENEEGSEKVEKA